MRACYVLPPTERNGLVADHYAKLGFEALSDPDATGRDRLVGSLGD